MQNKTSLVINILLIVFGLVGIIFGIKGMQSNSDEWPSAQGEVTSVSTSGSTDTDGNSEYDVTIFFKYTVNGTEYTSNRSERTNSDTNARQIEEENKPGTALTLYYDPQDPGTNVSSPGEAEGTGFLMLVVGVVFIGIGAWGIFNTLKPNQRPLSDDQDQ